MQERPIRKQDKAVVSGPLKGSMTDPSGGVNILMMLTNKSTLRSSGYNGTFELGRISLSSQVITFRNDANCGEVVSSPVTSLQENSGWKPFG